jgi:hypothetical protein
VIELVLRSQDIEPRVERLEGPFVRLTVPAEQDLSTSLAKCRDDLFLAIEWALLSMYDNEKAPSRVFVRDANGQEMSVMVDPCVAYGLEAIIRPKDL